MGVEKFLEIWSQYNIPLIQGLFGFILILILFLAFKNFFGASEEFSTGVNPDIEKTLQKILEQSQRATLSVGSEMSASHVSLPGEEHDSEEEGMDAEASQKLEAALAAKDLEIAELKNAQAAKVGGGEELKTFKDQIKLLEERLSEYEIIAEDIADLSKFKEENSNLQREIENLKKSGGSVAAPIAQKVEAPVIEEIPTPVAPLIPSPVPEPPAPEVTPVDSAPEMDDLEKEFQALVEAQKAGSLSQQEAALTAAPTLEEPPALDVVLEAAPAMPTVADTQMDIDAILAQHSSNEPAVVEAAPKSDDNRLLGDFEKFIEKKEEKG